MKKILVYVMLVCLLMLSGCSLLEFDQHVSVKDLKTDTLASKNKIVSNKNAQIVDSFYDEHDNWYYTIEIGAMTNVPLQNMNNTGMIRWTQNSTSYSKTVTTTVTESSSMKEMLENQVTNIISSSTENKLSIALGAEKTAGLNYFGLAEASAKFAANVAYESVWKNSSSFETQYTSSFEKASSKTVTESISETIIFDSSCPTGFYGWNLCGNLKVYAFLIYNKDNGKYNINYFTDIVATYWSFDYLTDDEFANLSLGYNYTELLDFNVPELVQPSKFVALSLNLVHTQKYDSLTLLINDTEVLFDVDVNASTLKKAGYTAFNVMVTFTLTENIIFAPHSLKISIGDDSDSNTVEQKKLEEGETYSIYLINNNSTEFSIDYFVDGINTVIVTFDAFPALTTIIYDVEFTIRFYNPNK